MSKFTARLKQRELLVGTMMSQASPEIAEMLSKCGFDWLFLDGEHGLGSITDWQRVLQAVAGRTACILRVPSCNDVDIKKALDIGVDGIIVPMINTAQQAKDAVAYSRYPPQGRRGLGPARAHGYGMTMADYVARANDEVALIVQAEHIDAVENIDSIAEVEGVDAIFIGPADLSASLGRIGQTDHPAVLEAIDAVAEACRQRRMPLGYFGATAEQVRPFIKSGHTLICAGSDAGFLIQGALQLANALRS